MILLEEIEKVAFLKPFTAVHRKKIAQAAQLQEHLAGDEIFSEGDHNPFLCIVLTGEAALDFRVSRLGTVPVLTVVPGELVGWSSLLGGGPMTATARAQTRHRLAALDAAQILALAEQDPRFGVEFFRGTSAALAQRLYAARVEIPHSARGRNSIRSEAAD
ncbi:MAG TPA: cyclic nucleotide-binding domain-containing protein [Gemmataceae bacterium]|nr:cyclic nucleotide-binding domain-containing protein [Gemmataceae bacterium]